MAQVREKSTHVKGNRRRTKKIAAHLDMTPMVDLAFLLLTFFMLTNTFNKLQTMELNMPVPHVIGTDIACKNALTLILAADDQVYYYFGFAGDEPEVQQTDFSGRGLRRVLVSERVKSNKQLVVLIKAMETSRYKNLVDVLDELKITETEKYALVAVQEEEKNLIQNQMATIAAGKSKMGAEPND